MMENRTDIDDFQKTYPGLDHYIETVQRKDITTVNSFLFKEMLKMKRREKTPAIRKRTQSPRITQVHLYPFPQERKYTKYLFDLMDVYSDIVIPSLRNNMERWINEQKLDSVRTDDFNTEFQQLNNELRQTQSDMFDPDGSGVTDDKGNIFNAGTIITALTVLGFSISNFNKKQGDKFTKQVLGVPFLPSEPWVDEVIGVWANTNFELIKSLTDEYIKKVNFIVPEGIANGDTWDKIMRDFRKMDKNMTRSRGRLLARDQTGKLNGRLTKRRNQELGLDLYRWLTAQDERVRKTHKVLNGKIMRWDNDSVYADTVADARAGNWKSRSSISGYVGIPGQDIQCRCTSTAVFDQIIEDIDKELADELKEIKGEGKPSKTEQPTSTPVAKPRKTSRSELEKKVKRTEDSIINNTNFEEARVFDDKGKIILSKKGPQVLEGQGGSVKFSIPEQQKINGARVLTHNHPSRNSIGTLSPDDVQFALDHKIKEIRSVHRDATVRKEFSYSASGFSKDLTKKQLISEYDRQLIKVAPELVKEVEVGEVSELFAMKTQYHRAWEETSKKLKFKYKREER